MNIKNRGKWSRGQYPFVSADIASGHNYLYFGHLGQNYCRREADCPNQFWSLSIFMVQLKTLTKLIWMKMFTLEFYQIRTFFQEFSLRGKLGDYISPFIIYPTSFFMLILPYHSCWNNFGKSFPDNSKYLLWRINWIIKNSSWDVSSCFWIFLVL